MGELFYHMDLLATPEVIECSATDLVGEYLGHNGPKILAIFDRAVGKVLFIDEAHRLVKRDPFSKEAATDIVGAMSNPLFEQKMFIILAGYGQQMDTLLALNQDLRS